MTQATESRVGSNGGVQARPVESLSPKLQFGSQALLFDKTWTTTIIGQPAAVELRIYSDDPKFLFQFLISFAGQRLPAGFVLDGETSERLPLSYGFFLDVDVSNWRRAPTQASFLLTVALSPPFGLEAIPVVTTPVTIPLRSVASSDRLAAPQSPSDFLAMMQLSNFNESRQRQVPSNGMRAQQLTQHAELQSRPTQQLSSFATMPEIRELASGTFSYGWSLWGGSENPLVYPMMLPIGSQRVGDADVFLSPGSGGWCKFLRWYDPTDPTDGRFYFHVGWSGTQGGTVNWVINGYPSS